MPRIYVVGASGSGTTTLGVALAKRLGVPHVETDALFWIPTDPPFTTRRPAADRLTLLRQHLPVTGHWVFAGSALKWGTPLEPFYDLIVFLRLDPTVRMERLRRREVERYGARLEAGGNMAAASAEFLEWAASYNAAGPDRRSLVAHEAWLAVQKAPVLRLDSSASIQNLVSSVLSKLA